MDLKVNLFTRTLCYFKILTDMIERGGCGTDEWKENHAKFVALYGLIELSELEGEYHEWKVRMLEGGEGNEVEGKDQVNE